MGQIFANHVSVKEQIPRIYKGLLQLDQKKKNQNDLKVAKDLFHEKNL